ncbi:uncharacterized protein LOC120131839 [Hibiscus syriacus]|uniref:uncharacterized protein LOC120131839 n=1 Tax=Hibiscus syriacus TaxID=106335 RepID=UPI001921E944|nr:uncharacterized protein LOC120131839 [Hibiscus syriacus]
MQVLMSLLHSNGYVHDFSTNDVTNKLEALFFVHPTSFKIWRAFPHVLMIDATYKTNKYNMPFVEIVGVTSTRKTFCIAFAFISEEKMDNYKWVLECLKLTLDECMLPRVIITDRELALMKACEKVFSNATRLLCRWHISQNILKNCRPTIKTQRDWDSFLSAWKLLEDSSTWISYMENYKQLQLVLRKYPREDIPLDSIDIFWRTLDVSWSTPLENEDIQCDDELHIFKEKFKKQSNAGKKSFLRKLADIFNPSTNLIKEPAVKKNTRGRPSLKKQKKKKCVDPKNQDPGKSSYSTRFFDIDLNLEPTNIETVRHSSYVTSAHDLFPNLNEEPARHSSYVSQSFTRPGSERFLKQLPQIFRHYLTGLQDVIGDGNCGFRSVAVALGLSEDQWPRIRSDLVRELDVNQQKYKYIFGTTDYKKIYKTVQLAGKWMEMPNTGLIIASAYNRVVISLANGGNVGGCTTIFPLWSSPPQSEPHGTIVIAHVNDNHYIKATLREGCPLPMTHPLWITYKSDIASAWEDPYVSRQEEFREYYFRIPETFDLSK